MEMLRGLHSSWCAKVSPHPLDRRGTPAIEFHAARCASRPSIRHAYPSGGDRVGCRGIAGGVVAVAAHGTRGGAPVVVGDIDLLRGLVGDVEPAHSCG